MNEWIDLKKQKPDLNKIHFLVDGNSIFLKGTRLQPFFFQLCGEMKYLEDCDFTHWMPIPSPPKE